MKIRQVRRSATYQFGYLIPRDCKHALELDKINGNSRWYDATKMVLDQINKYQIFIDHGLAKYDPKSKRIMNPSQGLTGFYQESQNPLSCCHMNCCLQKHTTHQFTYFIYYSYQDKLKNSRNVKIHQLHQKIYTQNNFYYFV